MPASNFKDYIGGGEWHGDTDCTLAKFADEMQHLEAKLAAAQAENKELLELNDWYDEGAKGALDKLAAAQEPEGWTCSRCGMGHCCDENRGDTAREAGDDE